MRIVTFASGSSGNCSLVSKEDTHILIDAGISARRIKNNLASLGLSPDDLDAIVITHEHSDHISGLANLLKQASVPVFAPEFTADYLKRNVSSDCICTVSSFSPIQIGEISVTSFPTPHDTRDSCGYRFESAVTFGFATDTGHITDDMKKGLLGADAVLIEANHDEDMVISGPYPAVLKQRILSDRGHLSNRCCGVLARELCLSGTRNFILGHLSQENNRPGLAFSAVKEALDVLDAEVFIAPRNEPFILEIPENGKC